MQYDKINGDVAFTEADHRYFNTKYPNRKYTSVTTLISFYHEKFDSEFWSSYKAMEALLGVDEFKECGLKTSLLKFKIFDEAIPESCGITYEEFLATKQSILASYKQANEEACERGTKYHTEKENALYTKPKVKIEEIGLPLDLKGEFNCERHNFDLNQQVAILPEYLIYWSSTDEIINLAGQVDLIVKQGNDIYILDYKTNAKGMEMSSFFDRKKKQSKKMFYPINNLDDCMFQHYTLQLSLYAWMLQRINPEFNIKEMWLLHVDGEGKETSFQVEYIKEDVERLIKHYKKSLVIDHYRNTGVHLDQI